MADCGATRSQIVKEGLKTSETNQTALAAPQLILAGVQLVQGVQGAHLLIPTSSGILTITSNQLVGSQIFTMNNLQSVASSVGDAGANTTQQLLPGGLSQCVTNASGAIDPQYVVLPASQLAYNVQGQPTTHITENKTTIAQTIAPTMTDTTQSATQTIQRMPSQVTTAQHVITPNAEIADTNTVDGVNLKEIEKFAKAFVNRRLALGLTQAQIGQALSITEGPAYSQSVICKFENLDITPRSAQKIKLVLERWINDTEEQFKNKLQNRTEYIGFKKRKSRTTFTSQALDYLNQHYRKNAHPSVTEILELAKKLNYNYDVIRVWFCNKRQAQKKNIKKTSIKQMSCLH